MGKKKNKVNLENLAPLESATIGEIKPPKFVFFKTMLLIVFFGAIIFFLPEIKGYLDLYILGQSNSDPVVTPQNGNTTNTTNNTTPEEKEPEEEIDKDVYVFNETTEVDLSKEYNFKLTDIALSDDGKNISFNIIATKTNVDLSRMSVYLVLYNSDSLPFKYYHLAGELSTTDKMPKIFDSADAKKFAVRLMTESNYPIYESNSDESGKASIECKKGIDTYTYEFVDDKLTVAKYNTTLSKSLDNYTNLSLKYKDLLNNYGSKPGYTVEYDETSDDALKFSMSINYTITDSVLTTGSYYSKDTAYNVIMFEMESELYDCK